LTNFSNGKQTQESLESGFPETTFRKTNTTNKRENTFLETKPNFSLTGKCFPLTGKCFPLTNFSNDKQTQESLESGFPESEFRKTNMTLGKINEGYYGVYRLKWNEYKSTTSQYGL
jgi:hypothetical protein